MSKDRKLKNGLTLVEHYKGIALGAVLSNADLHSMIAKTTTEQLKEKGIEDHATQQRATALVVACFALEYAEALVEFEKMPADPDSILEL